MAWLTWFPCPVQSVWSETGGRQVCSPRSTLLRPPTPSPYHSTRKHLGKHLQGEERDCLFGKCRFFSALHLWNPQSSHSKRSSWNVLTYCRISVKLLGLRKAESNIMALLYKLLTLPYLRYVYLIWGLISILHKLNLSKVLQSHGYTTTIYIH